MFWCISSFIESIKMKRNHESYESKTTGWITLRIASFKAKNCSSHWDFRPFADSK